MVDDSQLVMYGIEIGLQDEKYLEVVSGKPTTDAPCEQWYLDPDRDRPQREGYSAIYQRYSGCRAYIRKEHIRSCGMAGKLPLFPQNW